MLPVTLQSPFRAQCSNLKTRAAARVSSTSAIELNTKNKSAAPPQFRFCFCCYHKKVIHFSAGRFTSKSREISLTMNVIYSGCCECFLYLYAKCFISPTSAIELNTKNKLAAPPQFRFWFDKEYWAFSFAFGVELD